MHKEIEKMNVAVFLKGLQQIGNPVRALADQRYHKSKREHWGVSAPACNQFIQAKCKGMTNETLQSLAEDLWQTNIFDPMICAAKILSLPRLKPSLALWQILVDFLKQVDGWALEDQLAHVAWKCILSNRLLLNEIEKWTQHPNFWMRRAALVYTLPFAKQGQNPERMLLWASSYAGDSEWFIQKAIGWWLRVLGKHNPERVILFLNEHWEKLKWVAKKEATRKLTPEFSSLLCVKQPKK